MENKIYLRKIYLRKLTYRLCDDTMSIAHLHENIRDFIQFTDDNRYYYITEDAYIIETNISHTNSKITSFFSYESNTTTTTTTATTITTTVDISYDNTFIPSFSITCVQNQGNTYLLYISTNVFEDGLYHEINVEKKISFDLSKWFPIKLRQVSFTIKIEYTSNMVNSVHMNIFEVQIPLDATRNTNAIMYIEFDVTTNTIQTFLCINKEIVTRNQFNIKNIVKDLMEITGVRNQYKDTLSIHEIIVYKGIMVNTEMYCELLAEDNNIFIGSFTGKLNETGHDNIFMGSRSGKRNNSGSNNIYLGSRSGENNVQGNNNVYIGNKAGFIINDGSNNVLLGSNLEFSRGNNNIMIGSSSSKSIDELSELNDEICIGEAIHTKKISENEHGHRICLNDVLSIKPSLVTNETTGTNGDIRFDGTHIYLYTNNDWFPVMLGTHIPNSSR